MNSDRLVPSTHIASEFIALIERLLQSETAQISCGCRAARAFLVEPPNICSQLSSLGEQNDAINSHLVETALRCHSARKPLINSDQETVAVPLPATNGIGVVVTFRLKHGDAKVLRRVDASIRGWSESVQDMLIKHLEALKLRITRTVVRDSPASMIAVNGAGIVVMFNSAAEVLFGYSANEVLGTYVARLYASEDEARKVGGALNTSLTGSISNIEVRVRCKDGCVVPINLSAKQYLDPSGRRIGSFSIFHDSRVLQKLYAQREATAYYHDLVLNLPDPTILLDCGGNIEIFNTAAAELFGCPAEDVLGQSITQFYADPEEAREVGHLLRKAPFRVRNLEALTKNRMGLPIPVSLSARGLRDAKGAYVGSIGVFKDLRGIRHAERLNAFESFATSTSHKLKGSLQTAKLTLGRLQRSNLTPQDQKLVKTALRSIDEASQEAYNLSFSSSSPQESVKERLSLRALEKDTLRLQETAQASKIGFCTSVSDPYTLVEIDSRQFFQLTHNFFQNSLHALSEKRLDVVFEAVIKMNLSATAGALIMEWYDNGIGIPPEDISEIFDASFSRKKNQPISGLGLAIVKGIVDGHGGQIEVESEVGQFTKFKLTLPCEQGVQPELSQGDSTMVELSIIDEQYETIDYGKLVMQEITIDPSEREESPTAGESLNVS